VISARGSRRSGKRQKANGAFTPAQRAMVAGWWPEFGASPALEATTADHAVLDVVEFIGTTRHRRGDRIPEQTTTVRDGQQVTVSVEVDALAGTWPVTRIGAGS
jgi:hypothetical protein